MGLFSRKKKLSKEEQTVLDEARKELEKSKENTNQLDKEDYDTLTEDRKKEFKLKNSTPSTRPTQDIEMPRENELNIGKSDEQIREENKIITEKAQKNQKEMDEFNAKVEEDLQKKQEEFNNNNAVNSTQETLDDPVQSTCSVSDCNKQVDFFSGKKCKFCKKQFCFDHIQLEKHECAKTTPTKFLRKTWLRRYDLNISSGKYIVVCDDCGYVSGYGALIDEAGDERKYHIENNHCNSKQVFLEEDLSEEKVEKNIDLEQVVPSDRDFWVCSHCRPAQKFTDRSAYIAHHFSHG